jgi:hypothetical protein
MEVTVFSTSPSKEKEAISILGADHFVVSKDTDQLKVTLGISPSLQCVLVLRS